MRRRYYQSRGKGWFGDPERHRQSALGVKTGSKRAQRQQARERMAELQFEAERSVAMPAREVPTGVTFEEPPIETKEPVQSVISQDNGGREWAVGREGSTTTSTNGLFRPAPPVFFAKKVKR